ncbi:MAG: hypothetical protein II393_01155 [Cytophagales bacterium]|nr:hypothetical protein [Cytophagales bacterium]
MNRKVIVELISFFLAVECWSAVAGNIIRSIDKDSNFFYDNECEADDNKKIEDFYCISAKKEKIGIEAYYYVEEENFRTKICNYVDCYILAFCSDWDYIGRKRRYENENKKIGLTDYNDGSVYYTFPKSGYIYKVRLFFPSSIVEKFDRLFAGCGNLIKVDFVYFEPGACKKDVAISLRETFKDCVMLENVNFYELNGKFIVGEMEGCFLGCSVLWKVYINSFFDDVALDVSRVESFRSVFEGCSALEEIDFSVLNMQKKSVLIDRMFWGCSSLQSIVWPAGVMLLYSENPFEGCNKLKDKIPSGERIVSSNKCSSSDDDSEYDLERKNISFLPKEGSKGRSCNKSGYSKEKFTEGKESHNFQKHVGSLLPEERKGFLRSCCPCYKG